MVLQEKVQVLMGTAGSNMMKIINEVANKYKVIARERRRAFGRLMDATNFSRYSFMTSLDTEQIGRGMAYYYGQIRKKEKKFYILCQDYSFGRGLAEGFKKGLKEYYPEAQIVGEDYHKLFLTDFAPYLTKIKASGAEVIFTGDWVPDAGNLLKQARQMGIMLPFANVFMNEPNLLHEIGIEGTKGPAPISMYDMPPPFQNYPRAYQILQDLEQPLEDQVENGPLQQPSLRAWTAVDRPLCMQTYWLLSVMERAKSTDPEKIIKLWEGDTYRMVNGKVVKMRACDHKVIQDLLRHRSTCRPTSRRSR